MSTKRTMIDFRHISANTGFSSYLRMILSALNETEREFYLLINDNNFDFTQYLTNNKNIKFIYAKSKPFSLKQNIEIPLLIRKYGIDIFHTINYDVPLFMFLCPKCRLVSTIHDLIPYTHKHLHKRSFIKYIYFDFMYNACAKLSDKILTVSEYSKNEIIKHLKVNPKRVIVIHNSFIGKNLPNKDKIEFGNPAKLLFIGSNFEHKNILAVVKAVKILKEKNINVIFNIAGMETVYTDVLRDYISKNNLQGNINILGKIPADKVEELYENSDIFVFPSLIEGFGIPPLEAMNYGLPVISSDKTVMPEVIGDAGILIEPSAENFAEKIEYLINNPDFANELVKRGYERIKEFSQSKFSEKYIEFIEGQ